MDEIWQGVLRELEERVGKQNFDTWIKPIRMCEEDRGEVLLEVPNKFFRDWVAEHFLAEIRQIMTTRLRQNIRVTLRVNQELQTNQDADKP